MRTERDRLTGTTGAAGPADSVGSGSDPFAEILARRIRRRALLGGAAAVPLLSLGTANPPGATAASAAGFSPIEGDSEDRIAVPEGYRWETLAAWGQPVDASAPEFDPFDLDPAAQRRQVGYNCDFVAWFDYVFGFGLVGVNHEYTNPELMFPDYDPEGATRRQVDYEIAAHGASILVVWRSRGASGPRYRHFRPGYLNRRIHGETPILLSGPAAGHPLVRTGADPEGRTVHGTFSNCGGGVTPWGTYLTAEENFDEYFANGAAAPDERVREANRRFAVCEEGGVRPWWRFHRRFDLRREPNEIHRFGWIVEVDPYDPRSTPRKRTALGRFKHEAAAATLSKRGAAVVYSGDDARFEYVYKFVSEDAWDGRSRRRARTLLDRGVLHAAKFHADGTGEWRPLRHGTAPLDRSNGFSSQADVLLFARQAADLLGATPMDRPEDVDVNPVTGKVYVALTNNTEREPGAEDAANPRAPNPLGHIVEITEEDGDAGATRFRWEIFLLCGDPADPAHGAFFAGFDPARVSRIANPDNLAFDDRGNLFVATDGQPGRLGINDGVFFVPTEGPERGFVRQVFSGVVGAECASVILNTAQDLMLVSLQHPGEGGTRRRRISSFGGDVVNRPAVIAVTRAAPPYRIGA